MLECAGLSQPLFVVSGQCQGIEITLDSESVPFGAVVLGSRSTRKLIMRNTGDIGAAFAWNLDKFKPDFSIGPVDGYISPGMEVPFEIVFHPTVVNHDIRYEVSFVTRNNENQNITYSRLRAMSFVDSFRRVCHVRLALTTSINLSINVQGREGSFGPSHP